MKNILQNMGKVGCMMIGFGICSPIYTAQRPLGKVSASQMQVAQALKNISLAEPINPQLVLILDSLTSVVESLQKEVKILSDRLDLVSQQMPTPQLMDAIRGMLSNNDRSIKELVKAFTETQRK